MPTITEYYGITRPVPFVDVEVSVDNRLYLDPHAVRLLKSPQPFASQALEAADTFFREVTACAISTVPTERQKGERLLQQFVEPWETRLGMAAEGFHGHGGASTVGTWIWTTLTTDVEALVRVGILRQIEDLALFVDGVDRDITSDVATRIMFMPLANFTASVLEQYPEFAEGAHDVRKVKKQVWDVARREWRIVDVLLPVVEGKPLLLVPHVWARPTLLMSAGRFYDTSVLSFVQLEQAVRNSEGKLLTTRKDDLKKQAGLQRGRPTIRRVTQRAFESEQDLLAAFKSFVASRWTPPIQDERHTA